MKNFGLIGKNISYSFSKKYFTDKFQKENISDSSYDLFDIPLIEEVINVFNTKNIVGLNVTIPYKQDVIKYLDSMSEEAEKIGAVNTIKIENGKKVGYNTDVMGFEESIKPLLKANHKKCLILGTGGASKAVAYSMNKLKISPTFVSRSKNENTITYLEVTKEILAQNTIIINCSPVGTFPKIEEAPNLPYEAFTENHLAYDLIYNPEETTFLKLAKKQGAITKNGLDMLIIQAEKAWEIWNS